MFHDETALFVSYESFAVVVLMFASQLCTRSPKPSALVQRTRTDTQRFSPLPSPKVSYLKKALDGPLYQNNEQLLMSPPPFFERHPRCPT